MERCHGIKRDTTRCRKLVRRSRTNTVRDGVYCAVHYVTTLRIRPHTELRPGEWKIPEPLRTSIPAELHAHVGRLSVPELTLVFGPGEGNLFDEIMAGGRSESRLPDHLLRTIPPVVLATVRHLAVDELETLFAPLARVPEELFECGCCHGEFFVRDRVSCSAPAPRRHDFCRECLTRYVTDRITGGGDIGCMGDACPGTFGSALEEIVTPRLCETYREETPASAGIVPCESAVVLKATIEEILRRHRARSCSNPKCGKVFARTDACNKMTCPCGTKSCYVCRATIRDYDHFHNVGTGGRGRHRCPLYTNEREIESMSLHSALDEIVTRYETDRAVLLGDCYPILCRVEAENRAVVDAKFGVPPPASMPVPARATRPTHRKSLCIVS